MTSLAHGVNLSRRACRRGRWAERGGAPGILAALLVPLISSSVFAGPVLSTSTTSNTPSNQRNQPPDVPIDYFKAYPGLGFGPMGPVPIPTEQSSVKAIIKRSTSSMGPIAFAAAEATQSGHPTAAASTSRRIEVVTVEFHRVETPFLIGLWILFASLAKIGFHMTPNLSRMFPESCLLIAVGVVIGALLHYIRSVHVSPLTPDTFFLYMLPPIILDAGYFMPNRLFFDHLGTILLFAVVGTIFNTLTIGASLWACGQSGMFGCDTPLLDMLLFGALVSAVDPVAVLAVFEEIHVNEILYIVVFGESLLNDAVTVVLYHMFEAYSEMESNGLIIMYTDIMSGLASFLAVAVGGTAIGVAWGFATGLVTRFTDQVRVIEPIFIFVMAYLAYLNAEIFHMSGILAITFCGITMKNYVEANISHKSHTTVKYAMKMLSSSSETIIFMFLGVATVNNNHVWNTWFVVLTIVFCSVFRIIGVIIFSAVANRFRLHKLDKVEKFVMSYGGLRGAVAFALVLLIDKNHVKLQPMFVTTTIAVIYFTVFVQGITIKPLVRILNVKRAEKRKPTMNERIHERFMDHLMAGVEDILGKHGNHHIRDKFKRFDNRFIRPFLLRDYQHISMMQGAEPKILETYSKLTMKDAIEYMQRNATMGNISGTESMSAIFRNYTSGNFNGSGTCSTTTKLSGSPSFSQLDTSTWNIDMQELEYNPSKKDLTDARIHHLLAEELCKPYRRHRRLSYSRHAVDDRDLSTQLNYKKHMNIRRLVGERKHHHKRSKRGNKEGKQNHVSFPEFQQNGSAKQFTHDYINEVLQEDGDDDKKVREGDDGGIIFTAKSSLPDEDILEEDERRSSHTSNADVYGMGGGGCAEGGRVATPTATETMLPWKREDGAGGGALKQSEFPAWASNKEYLAYSSPSATFLGGMEQPKHPKSIIGLFRRESSGSGGPAAEHPSCGSDSESSWARAADASPAPLRPPAAALSQRSASLGGHAVLLMEDVAHSDPLGASSRPASILQGPHRGQLRRGSMLELSGSLSRDAIMEEKGCNSLPESSRMSVRRQTLSQDAMREVRAARESALAAASAAASAAAARRRPVRGRSFITSSSSSDSDDNI